MTTTQSWHKTKNKHVISTDIMSATQKKLLSRNSRLSGISTKGLTLQSKKKYLLIPEKDFSRFLNQPVELLLSQYELPFDGVVTQISSIEEDLFEIQIDFSKNTPLYYKECVEALLN